MGVWKIGIPAVVTIAALVCSPTSSRTAAVAEDFLPRPQGLGAEQGFPTLTPVVVEAEADQGAAPWRCKPPGLPTLATPRIQPAESISLLETVDSRARRPAPLALDRRPLPPPPAPRGAGQLPSIAPAAADAQADRQLVQTAPSIVVQTSSPRQVTVGKAARVEVTVSNPGDTVAQGLQLFLTLPEQTELLGAEPQPAARSFGVLRFDLGELPTGAAQALLLEIIPRSAGLLPLETSVRFSATARTTIRACQPELQIACRAPDEATYGSPVVFRLVIRNIGQGTAEGVTLQPLVLEPGEGVQSRPESVPVGTIGPGQERSVHYKVPAIGSGRLALRFEVADDQGSRASADGRLIVRRPALEVTTSGPAAVFLGHEAMYELGVFNFGDAAAEHVQTIIVLPAGLRLLVVDRPVAYGDSERELVWQIQRLPAGASEVLQFKTQAVAQGDQSWQAIARAAGGLQSDARQLTAVIRQPHVNIDVGGREGL